jgi:hypothetical protein
LEGEHAEFKSGFYCWNPIIIFYGSYFLGFIWRQVKNNNSKLNTGKP